MYNLYLTCCDAQPLVLNWLKIMKNNLNKILCSPAIFWTLLISIFFAGTEVFSSPQKEKILKSNVLVNHIRSPLDVVVRSHGKYLVSHMDESGKGLVSEFSKGKFKPLISELKMPRALAFDRRRARLFIVDENQVKIVKVKGPKQRSIEVKIPTSPSAELVDICFSIMNHKAYLASSDGTIWSLDPKRKMKVKEILSSQDFLRFGKRRPQHLLVSADGARLYVLVENEESMEMLRRTSLLAIKIRSKKINLITKFPAGISFSGLSLRKGKFYALDEMSGDLYTVSREASPQHKKTSLGKSQAFVMDLHFAVWITEPDPVSPTVGNLMRFSSSRN